MFLQEVQSQRAVAALQAAANQDDAHMDADVAAETAAVQSACRQWVTSQQYNQQRQPLDLLSSLRQPASKQCSNTEVQHWHSALNKLLTATCKLCSGPAQHRASPTESRSADQRASAADKNHGIAPTLSQSMHDFSHPASDAAAEEDAGHLHATAAQLAATQGLCPIAATKAAVPQSEQSCVAIKLDQPSRDRSVSAVLACLACIVCQSIMQSHWVGPSA